MPAPESLAREIPCTFTRAACPVPGIARRRLRKNLSALLYLLLVSNDLSLETSCRDFWSRERRDDHGLSNTAERCGSGAANAGEVVAIGSSDPLDYAEVAEPAKLA